MKRRNVAQERPVGGDARHGDYGSPAALAPLRQSGPFLAQGGVITVAGIDDGVIAVDPEHPALQAGHEGIELRRICCPPRAAGEAAVTGERPRHGDWCVPTTRSSQP